MKKKYALTNSEGVSPCRHRLAPGKFLHDPKTARAMHKFVNDCCYQAPVLAAMVSPFPADACKLYEITCWNFTVDPSTSGQAYTVVKEATPVPQVSVEQKLQFAMLVMRDLLLDRAFQKWIDLWMTGMNRSAEAAAAAREMLEKETRASDDLETLAAWGKAGGNDTSLMSKRTDLVVRALHLTRAAERAASDANDPSIAIETALALNGIARWGKLDKLAALAEKVAAVTEVPEAANAA